MLGDDSGEGPAPAVPPSAQAVELGAWLFVPQFDAAASSGAAPFAVDHVDAMRPFALRDVREQLAVPHNALFMVRVHGASIEPGLRGGDVVMVDKLDSGATLDGLHLVRIDGAVSVRGLQRIPGQRFRVGTKVPGFDPYQVLASEIDILGRVRWAGVHFA
jgi:phage repressor protein C with HTH and peptisase S24 domain